MCDTLLNGHLHTSCMIHGIYNAHYICLMTPYLELGLPSSLDPANPWVEISFPSKPFCNRLPQGLAQPCCDRILLRRRASARKIVLSYFYGAKASMHLGLNTLINSTWMSALHPGIKHHTSSQGRKFKQGRNFGWRRFQKRSPPNAPLVPLVPLLVMTNNLSAGGHGCHIYHF